MIGASLREMLSDYEIRWQNELDLQDALAKILLERGVAFEREARLSQGNVVDFLVGRTAIECKTDGSLTSLTRQIFRYLRHPDVDEVLVVTTKATHLPVARKMAGKTVAVHYVAPI